MDDASMSRVVLARCRRPGRLPQVRLVLAVVLLLVPLSVRAEGRRVALVIGNGAYQYMPSLANPVADARAVAATLQQLGFQVDRKENLDLHGLREAFRHFGEQARGAEVALVYFAGHGMQAVQQDQAENYLLPVDARLQDVDDIDDQAVPLTRLLALLRDTQIRVVLLDSCRDNPVVARLSGQGTRGMARSGLAPVPEQEARGALIGFAAAPGQQAKDGTGQHSPYAAALLQHLAQPGLEVDLMLRQVAADVEDATDGRQIPEHWNRLRGREGLYLAGPLPLGLTAPAPPPQATPAMVPVPPVPVDRPVSPPTLGSSSEPSIAAVPPISAPQVAPRSSPPKIAVKHAAPPPPKREQNCIQTLGQTYCE